MVYDLVIIGAGPSGLSAGIYAQRAMLKTIILEKESFYGGQVLSTYEVDNYPGFPQLGGFELADKFRHHAESLGVQFHSAEVENIIQDGYLLKITLNNDEPLITKTVIVATGSIRKNLVLRVKMNFQAEVFPIAQPVMVRFLRIKLLQLSAAEMLALRTLFTSQESVNRFIL